jgi:outer membrane protein assembly factor BamC
MQPFAFNAQLLLLLCVVSITPACSFIGDRSNEYKEAPNNQPYKIPSELSSNKVRDKYPVAEISNPKSISGDYVLPQPPDATAALTDAPFEIKTVEGNTWLELSMAPSKVWPLLDLFWQEYGLPTVHEEVDAGYFATSRLNDTSGHQDLTRELEATEFEPIVIGGMAFQSKLTQGVRRNSSELEVRALWPDHEQSSIHIWTTKSVNGRLERALLMLVGEYITSEAAASRYSLNAVNIGDSSRVKLLQDEANISYLAIELSFRRAWNEVGDALKNAGVVVSDVDRTEGVYFISYLDEEEINSWYTTESSLNELRKQQNIELRFYPDSEGVINVRAKMLTDVLEPEALRALIELVFENIS